MSRRKPYNDRAGYVSSRRNYITGDFNVLYRAAEAGMDTSDGPWATVCEKHGTICNHRSLTLARQHLPDADWCEACMRKADAT